MPLKWPETNYQSCSVKLSSSLDCNVDSVLYMTSDSKPCAHGRDSANDRKSKFDSYL